MLMRSFEKKGEVLKVVLNFLSSFFVGFLLILMDCLSYGTDILTEEKDKVKLQNISLVLYTYSTALAQVSFNFFTRMNTGIIAGPISEVFPFTRIIFSECEKYNKDSALFNFLLIMFITTLLFACFSLLIMWFDISRFLRFLAEPAICGCLAMIGVSQFKVGLGMVFSPQAVGFNWRIILGLAVSIGFFVIDEFLGKMLFIPFITMIIVGIFWTVVYFFKISAKTLTDNRWLFDRGNNILKPSMVYSAIHIEIGSALFYLRMCSNLITIIFVGSINIVVNLPSFSSRTKIKHNINKELRAQGISNFLSSFFFIPSYFINSYSVFFHKSGSSKISAMFLGVCILLISVIGPIILGIIPSFLQAAIPMMIGISFLYPVVYQALFEATIFEYLVIYFSGILAYFTKKPELGLILGLVLCVLPYFFFKKNEPDTHPEMLDSEVIKYCTPLMFFNINRMYSMIKATTKNAIIIDLSQCEYIDWKARIYLSELTTDTNKPVYLIGKPKCFKNYDSLHGDKLFKINNWKELENIREKIDV